MYFLFFTFHFSLYVTKQEQRERYSDEPTGNWCEHMGTCGALGYYSRQNFETVHAKSCNLVQGERVSRV